MATFANAAAFNDPQSRMKAQGVDVNVKHAIVDPSGKVLAYAQTGGMIGPVRHELPEGHETVPLRRRLGAAAPGRGRRVMGREGLVREARRLRPGA